MNRDALHAPLLDPCSGVDHHRYGFELPARVEYVSRARRLARARLDCWGIGEDVHDSAMLVLSELVTNAVVHSGSHLISCELSNGAERLRISVRDQGCSPMGPHVCHTLAAEERGRGLLLVEAVSAAWGAHEAHQGTGRTVWAEVARTDLVRGARRAEFPGAVAGMAAGSGTTAVKTASVPAARTESRAESRHPAAGRAGAGHTVRGAAAGRAAAARGSERPC
ncbi:ATP-binding protein [Streptomyces yaizuensis]|uniref:ATP-binding protein n=1 Tax=Streptomyces yaizuensis TaxID=2989713 RepID=A0ABQ5P6Z1_9ACTN|nr:ATP-binding protein [Streptomyces sp. YSPA8]GLF98358.1 ATP-binding protein [Streptomyces sp. YSPA8]